MLQQDSPLEKVQAVRSVTKSNVSTATPYKPAEVVHIDCHTDPITLEDVVLWGDILQAFDDALHIRHKSRVVPFLKGPDLKPLEPHRIAAIKDAVLDVIIAHPVTRPEAFTIQETPSVTPQSPPPEGPSQENIAVRRNPVYGLVETALENYTHIDNPFTSQPLRGPQTLKGDQQDDDNKPQETSPSNTGRRLQAPQDHTAASDAMDITQTMVNASLGNTSAQVALGKMYVRGQGVNQDYQAAMDWFCKAAEQEDPAGHFNVARMYDYALGVPMDHSLTMSGYLKASAKGYALAQCAIGALYYDGQGVPQSDTKAMDWYLRAAEQGLSQAEFQIGVMYSGGRGVLVDDSIALEWFNRAIEHGDSDGWGAYIKGYIHYCGLGVTEDDVTAMKWFIKAAQHDISRAHFRVGELYYFGKGVPKDNQKAMTWFMVAAGQGYSSAQYRVGSMYFKGDGVSLDYPKAIGWLHKAAEQGHHLAQFDLGWVYYIGKGVAKNPRASKSWLRKAAKQGHEGAKSYLQQIEREEYLSSTLPDLTI